MAEVHRGDWNDDRLALDFGVVETNAWPVLVVWLGSRYRVDIFLRCLSFLVSRVLPNGNNRIFSPWSIHGDHSPNALFYLYHDTHGFCAKVEW